MQYFAQDEATRMDPAPTVYETLASGSPNDMVPAIRNILGGFLFSGDDVYKQVRVLSGGERTRLAVARMLLRPSNTLLLDEPTNHLDLDSKEVLLDALVDYGGTLIFVSHDRYFVERLATKIIEVGSGTALVYPGTYKEFLWHKAQTGGGRARGQRAEGRRQRARAQRAEGQRARARAAELRAKGPLPPPQPPRPNPAKTRSAPTPKPAASSAPTRPGAPASTTSRPGSPSARTPSATSNRRCRPPVSTTIARPPSPSSTSIRRSCGKWAI